MGIQKIVTNSSAINSFFDVEKILKNVPIIKPSKTQVKH